MSGQCLTKTMWSMETGTYVHSVNYYSLQEQKKWRVKHCTTITELVIVWSLCSDCTSVTKSKAVVLLQPLLYPLQEVGKFFVACSLISRLLPSSLFLFTQFSKFMFKHRRGVMLKHILCEKIIACIKRGGGARSWRQNYFQLLPYDSCDLGLSCKWGQPRTTALTDGYGTSSLEGSTIRHHTTCSQVHNIWSPCASEGHEFSCSWVLTA